MEMRVCERTNGMSTNVTYKLIYADTRMTQLSRNEKNKNKQMKQC